MYTITLDLHKHKLIIDYYHKFTDFSSIIVDKKSKFYNTIEYKR